MALFPDPDLVNSQLKSLKEFVKMNAELFRSEQVTANGLCSELEVLQIFLPRHTESIYDKHDFVPRLAKKVRTLVYRAEDVIETYAATVLRHIRLRGSLLNVAFLAIARAVELHSIGKDMDVVTKDAVRIRDLLEVMKLLNTKESIRLELPVDDGMVGLRDAMYDVIDFLLDGKVDLQTLSIYGMAGLGKTTLVREVLKQPMIDCGFSFRAFIEVSQEFKRKEMLVKLVRAFGNVNVEDIDGMHETRLEELIMQYLEKRRYLIVLDDVWTNDVWDSLQSCFPNNNKNSRILITTRLLDVAYHAMRGPEPYKLRFLNPEESKELLQKRVSGTNEGINIPYQLNDQETNNILSKCNGLPLAIVVFAGVLKNGHLSDDSFSGEFISKFGIDKLVINGINMSFKQLPYWLKHCFLYLGVFQEDSEISAKTLYKLWVSEGFVQLPEQSNSEKTLEDIAEFFLMELVGKSLVIVGKRRLDGRIKTVRIHDSIRQFCKTKSLEEEFFREIKYHQHQEITPPMTSPRQLDQDDNHDRRLCINSNVGHCISTITTYISTGKYVRSFLIFTHEDYFNLQYDHIRDTLKAFKLLRVLDVRSIKFTQFPTELFYAFLLKYLAMFSNLKTIPAKVSNLRLLQTLIFETTQSSIEIKADICKMKHLRHLETNATITSFVKSLEPVSSDLNLETLTLIAPKCLYAPDLFKRAKQLKKIAVYGELTPQMEALFHSITQLNLLENLKLLNANGSPPLNCLPSDNSFPSKITRLTLRNTMLSWEWMYLLAKLKQLEVLKLSEIAFAGAYWVCDWETENSGGSFVALKVLHIGKTDLITWKASEHHFPQLKKLYLRHCSKLESVPSEFAYVDAFELIDIYCCNSEVAKSARKLVLAKLQAQNQEKEKGQDKKEEKEEEKKKIALLKLIVYPPEQ